MQKSRIITRFFAITQLGIASWCHPQLSPDQITFFLRPVSFTKPGVQYFFTHVFNHPDYGTYFLPASFRHTVDFLSFTKHMKNPYEYVLSVVDLFHTKLKESTWVNPYALSFMLDALMEHTKDLVHTGTTDTNKRVKKALYQALLSHFNDLKNNPDQFMDSLTDEIMSVVNDSQVTNHVILQYSISRLIESALDKLIWDPSEQINCWESCKHLANQLDAMEQQHLIPDEVTLNHCFWSLIYRFSYFVETTGDQLAMTTYQAIAQDIVTKNSPMLACEEQEHKILTKAERLKQALLTGEIKSRSAQAGLWVP